MTRDEFIKGYCDRSKVEWSELSERYDALPCTCGEDMCAGWAMVSRDPEMTAIHNQLYGHQQGNKTI